MGEEKRKLNEVDKMNLENIELESLENLLAFIPDEELPSGLEDKIFNELGLGVSEKNKKFNFAQTAQTDDKNINSLNNRHTALEKREKNSLKKAKKMAYIISSVAAVFILLVFSSKFLDNMNSQRGENNNSIEIDGNFVTSDSSSGFTGEKTEVKSLNSENDGGETNSSPIEIEEKKSENSEDDLLNEKSDSVNNEKKSEDNLVKGDLSKRKLVYRANLSIEVQDYKEIISDIKGNLNIYGGYIGEHESWVESVINKGNTQIELMQGHLLVRVPQEFYREFMDSLENMGKVSNINESVQDITSEYRDTEEEALNLESREKSLRTLMNNAKSMEDILAVDRELNEVRNQINSYRGKIKKYDDLVDMSTISIKIIEKTEKIEIKKIDESLGARIQQSFNLTINKIIYFGENLLVDIIGKSPFYLIVLIIGVFVLLVVVYLYRFVRKRIKK